VLACMDNQNSRAASRMSMMGAMMQVWLRSPSFALRHERTWARGCAHARACVCFTWADCACVLHGLIVRVCSTWAGCACVFYLG